MPADSMPPYLSSVSTTSHIQPYIYMGKCTILDTTKMFNWGIHCSMSAIIVIFVKMLCVTNANMKMDSFNFSIVILIIILTSVMDFMQLA